MNIEFLIYIIFYILTMCYLCFLSGGILLGTSRMASGNGAPVPAICRAVGWMVLSWVLNYLTYLPSMLYAESNVLTLYATLIFMCSTSLVVPFSIWALVELLQFHPKVSSWLPYCIVPEVAHVIWFLVDPGPYVITSFLILIFLSIVVSCICFYRLHKVYVEKIMSEYSNLNNRALSWTWFIWPLILVLVVSFLVSEFLNTYLFDYINMGIGVIIATLVIHYSKQMLPLSSVLSSTEEVANGILPEASAETIPGPESKTEPEMSVETEQAHQEELFAEIRERLKTSCEDAELYLDPDLTRDMLCRKAGVNRTYLSRYFQSEGISYYAYVNNLRIAYSKNIIDSSTVEPSILDISVQAGFSNVRTFRAAFKEIVGCLPSEYMANQKK